MLVIDLNIQVAYNDRNYIWGLGEENKGKKFDERMEFIYFC